MRSLQPSFSTTIKITFDADFLLPSTASCEDHSCVLIRSPSNLASTACSSWMFANLKVYELIKNYPRKEHGLMTLPEFHFLRIRLTFCLN